MAVYSDGTWAGPMPAPKSQAKYPVGTAITIQARDGTERYGVVLEADTSAVRVLDMSSGITAWWQPDDGTRRCKLRPGMPDMELYAVCLSAAWFTHGDAPLWICPFINDDCAELSAHILATFISQHWNICESRIPVPKRWLHDWYAGFNWDGKIRAKVSKLLQHEPTPALLKYLYNHYGMITEEEYKAHCQGNCTKTVEPKVVDMDVITGAYTLAMATAPTLSRSAMEKDMHSILVEAQKLQMIRHSAVNKLMSHDEAVALMPAVLNDIKPITFDPSWGARIWEQKSKQVEQNQETKENKMLDQLKEQYEKIKDKPGLRNAVLFAGGVLVVSFLIDNYANIKTGLTNATKKLLSSPGYQEFIKDVKELFNKKGAEQEAEEKENAQD